MLLVLEHTSAYPHIRLLKRNYRCTSEILGLVPDHHNKVNIAMSQTNLLVSQCTEKLRLYYTEVY